MNCIVGSLRERQWQCLPLHYTDITISRQSKRERLEENKGEQPGGVGAWGRGGVLRQISRAEGEQERRIAELVEVLKLMDEI